MTGHSVAVRANGGDPIAPLHPHTIAEIHALSMNVDMVLGFHPDFAAHTEPARPADPTADEQPREPIIV